MGLRKCVILMRCVLLNVDGENEAICLAGIGTKWEPNADALKTYCKTEGFEKCPRLRIYLHHAIGTSKLKVDVSQ